MGGHINVDNFEFDWDIYGATVDHGSKKHTAMGKVETLRSGAAYAYRRYHKSSVNLNCPLLSKVDCSFLEEVKFVPSDKRSDHYFGSSVSLSDRNGIVAIGCPKASLTGFYKESPSNYP